jgi:acetamidase/formamidase
MNMKNSDEIKEIVRTEFGFLADCFGIFELSIADASTSTVPAVNLPGVYVHVSPTLGVVKVGKSHKNSRKRAMEHIRDNTCKKDKSYEMARLANEPGAKVLLFNIISKEKVHWLLSLEYFLEKRLEPLVRSDRSG